MFLLTDWHLILRAVKISKCRRNGYFSSISQLPRNSRSLEVDSTGEDFWLQRPYWPFRCHIKSFTESAIYGYYYYASRIHVTFAISWQWFTTVGSTFVRNCLVTWQCHSLVAFAIMWITDDQIQEWHFDLRHKFRIITLQSGFMSVLKLNPTSSLPDIAFWTMSQHKTCHT